MPVHCFGIRHHGPGSARSVLRALEALNPDILLVEGPPDAAALIGMLGDPDMVPPVALLIYAEDDPAKAVYFPFVQFSPEYQAICYALRRGIPIRFMDLPQRYAIPQRTETPAHGADPLSALAKAAGYDDAERWWDWMVEQRRDSSEVFEAVAEAMTALRQEMTEPDAMEALREAYMRQTLAEAAAEGFEQIAVVCGAWHVPALTLAQFSEADATLLASLEAVNVAVTWVPWTYSRLARASGYGAGVRAPGWYRFLWENGDSKLLTIGWLTSVAQHLRAQKLDASTAQVIDAVHLAETLTRMRERALPDLQDLNEAALSVICHGNDVLMHIIERDLMVGSALGRVPLSAPMVPLERDFNREVERFGLTLSDEPAEAYFDLSNEQDRQTSAFLNRLLLLEIPWGSCQETASIYEEWELCWDPAYRIVLIEKSAWGNTVQEAATAFALYTGQQAQTLTELTELMQRVLQAELPEAVPGVMKLLEDRAATTGDISLLMEALPSLVDILVYGDVRRTPGEAIRRIVDGLAVRIIIGLPTECTALDDDASAKMLDAVIACNAALQLLNDAAFLADWHALLSRMIDQQTVHGLLRGRFCRIVLDSAVITKEETTKTMRLALARVVSAEEAAAWLTGFLRDSGIILIYHDTLLEALNDWVVSLSMDEFDRVLPLMRRIIATFEIPEVDAIGLRVSRTMPKLRAAATAPIDVERARKVDTTLDDLLGLKGKPGHEH